MTLIRILIKETFISKCLIKVSFMYRHLITLSLYNTQFNEISFTFIQIIYIFKSLPLLS